MRSKGYIDDVLFVLQGWKIQTLMYENKLVKDSTIKIVSVDNYTELKDEIATFLLELHTDHDDY